MNSLVILAAALFCLQAVRMPYAAGDSSEEEYHVLLPPRDRGLMSFLGVSNQPVIQAIKVEVPCYADPALKQKIIEQYLTARGLPPQVLAAAHNAAPARNPGADDLNALLENFYNLGLGTQPPTSTVSPNLDIKVAALNAPVATNVDDDDLNSHLENAHDLEVTTQLPTSTPSPTKVIKSIADSSTNVVDEPSTSTPPPTVVIKSIAEPSTNLVDEPFVTYDIMPARKRRHVLKMSTNTSPIESTTVPDVIETSTSTELSAVEGITVMLDLSPPVSSTESPISTTVPPTQFEPFIPLFGFGGSILPASVSRVSFAPRIPIDSTSTSTSTEAPKVLAEQVATVTTPLFPTHSRRIARAVSFNVMDQTQMTKVTPVPPLPQTDRRGTVMSHLPSSRKLRAVKEGVVAVPLAEEEGSTVVAEQEVTTQVNDCDIGCTKFDFNPVCAFNGECYHQFANQCVMDTFVCKRPDLGFKATPRQRCAMHWLKRCKAEELKSE